MMRDEESSAQEGRVIRIGNLKIKTAGGQGREKWHLKKEEFVVNVWQ